MHHRHSEREVQLPKLLLGSRPRRPRLRHVPQLLARQPRSRTAAVLRAEASELALAESMPLDFAETVRHEVPEGPSPLPVHPALGPQDASRTSPHHVPEAWRL